jgi:hypothetical protein
MWKNIPNYLKICIPNYHKILQMAVKRPNVHKIHQHLPLQDPQKFTKITIFSLKKPFGNPGLEICADCSSH